MSLYSRYHAISDERWLQLLAAAIAPRNSLSEVLRGLFAPGRWGPALPRAPNDQTQRNFVGSAGKQALEEGLRFYQVIKRQCRELGHPLSPETRILDFGCGWGRIFRFFLKDVPAKNLLGVDVDPEIIQ